MPAVIFRDVDPAVVQAVRDAFSDVPQFDIALGDIFSGGPADAIVSPANSYGQMKGGIDLAYVRHFGPQLEKRVAGLVRNMPSGILPIGQAVAVATGSPDIPNMISAPTMTTSGPVGNTQNAYLAFRAVLNVAHDQGFGTLLCPGLATQTGQMPPRESARQMRQAWDETQQAQSGVK